MKLSDYKENNFEVYHEFINIGLVSKIKIPHEWYFMHLFTKQEVLSDQKIATMLVKFVLQFYPNYSWNFFNGNDFLATAVVECELCHYFFLQKYYYKIPVDDALINRAMKFGDIVTDFLIRYRNFSLIKCAGQKIIITARGDCHKKFEDFLVKGYILQRKARIYYDGYFHKLPVLPTRESSYSFEELIETETGKYVKIIR